MKVRKRPVVVEAELWDGSQDSAKFIVAWIQDNGADASVSPGWHHVQRINIPTLEGTHEARPGDWIIKGVQGEFYPCKPDIFRVTYESAEAGTEKLE